MTLLDRIYDTLITPSPRAVTVKTGIWWGLSLAIALIFSILALHDGFSAERLVQDDARQYLFWMQRFQDPTLFPNDLIADYFQSVTPLGYLAIYRLGMALGIDPFTFNKILPFGLTLITTGYFFWWVMELIPLPFTAFLASLLLNQTLWMKDDLVSATPRAFIYPLFIAFLYYFTQAQHSHNPPVASNDAHDQSHIQNGKSNSGIPLKILTRIRKQTGEINHSALQPSRLNQQAKNHEAIKRNRIHDSTLYSAIAIVLLGFFYPQYVLVVAGVVVLSLAKWQRGIRINHDHDFWIQSSIYLTIVIAIVSFYWLFASHYGPVVTIEQARAMPEFWPGGRNFFFSTNLWWFYAVGDRSGFLHVGLVRPATLALGIFLPILMWRCPQNPVLRCRTSSLSLIAHLLMAATGLFILAHLLLFQLHLPSRYTDHTLRIIMAIASAIVITIGFEYLMRMERRKRFYTKLSPSLESTRNPIRYRGFAVGSAILFLIAILIYPVFVENFPLTKYKQGRSPRLYEFFQTQPTDSLIASVAEDVNNIPVFAQRSILVGREYAIPYHTGFYGEFRDRSVDLIRAQYTTDPVVVLDFIQLHGIDFWVIDEKAYEPGYIADHWTRQYYSEVSAEIEASEQGATPAIVPFIQPCTIAKQKPLLVVDTVCLTKFLTNR